MMMKRNVRRAAALAVPLLTTCLALAQASPTPAGADNVQTHFDLASKAAGAEHYGLYNMLCPRLSDPSAGKIATPLNPRLRAVRYAEPVKVFDNLYFVGEKTIWESSPSSWAISTSAGIIVVDALFEDSVKDEVEDGLKKVGQNPADIKYVIVTHHHADHSGGARYLQDHGAHIIMSAADWDVLYNSKTPKDKLPKRDMVATDGQKLTLGDETVTMYVTPGHTPGTISLVFPVTDHGVKHEVAEWGGTGFNFTTPDRIASFKTYRDSAIRFRDIETKVGADVLIANHPVLDMAEEKNAILAKRKAGDPNPYVIGVDHVRNYLTVASECASAGIASFNTTK
jgi:metallo-beta-lactamase class B